MVDANIILSYVALGLSAVLPIYYGSFSSLLVDGKKQSGDDEDDQEVSESLTSEDALMFPLIGSGVLFGLYLLFTYFSKEYINYLLTAYFAVLGCFAVAKTLSSTTKSLLNVKVFSWNQRFKLDLLNKTKKEIMFKINFDTLDVGLFVVSVFFTAYYVLTKNWIASNLFAESFAFSAIQLMNLDDFKTGMLLLSGLFFYDIFWVFGTDVMVTVAKNFDAPIKILFPRDLFAEKYQFAMLGLGDIVIPGIFVALCLRFDKKLGGGAAVYPRRYFSACMFSYIFGLAVTVLVMHTFQAAQPALLYLSPSCILSVLFVATVRAAALKLTQAEEKSKVDAKKSKAPKTTSTAPTSPKKKSS